MIYMYMYFDLDLRITDTDITCGPRLMWWLFGMFSGDKCRSHTNNLLVL